LSLSSQSSRSCAGLKIKVLKDKGLEFANRICTKTAIVCDDSEIGHFLCRFSSKKGLNIATIFLAEKVVFRCFR
jgi:hypothetical protein